MFQALAYSGDPQSACKSACTRSCSQTVCSPFQVPSHLRGVHEEAPSVQAHPRAASPRPGAREIAHALQLGVETIRTHSAHIRAKLGVRKQAGVDRPDDPISRRNRDPVDNTATTGLSPELTQRSPVSGDGQAKWGQLLSAAIRIFTNRDVAVCTAPVECAAVCPLRRDWSGSR